MLVPDALLPFLVFRLVPVAVGSARQVAERLGRIAGLETFQLGEGVGVVGHKKSAQSWPVTGDWGFGQI